MSAERFYGEQGFTKKRAGTEDNSAMWMLYGDEELMAMIHELEYKFQQKLLKQILRDVAKKTFISELRAKTPRGKTGNLYRSIGSVDGKAQSNAVIFVGPRMGGKNRNWEGWHANIIEYNKFQLRYPGYDKRAGKLRKRPKRPGTPGGEGITVHSGIMTRPMPYFHDTYKEVAPRAQKMMIDMARQRIAKIHEKYAKRTRP
jgi:hypothetical protein